MKIALFTAVAVFAGIGSGFSAETVKLSDVHLCCQSCVKGAQKAVGKVDGITAVGDKDAGTLTLTGPDSATVQKAADALVAGGYYGKSSDSKIKLTDRSGAKGAKVQSLKVEGVHLCCGKCVDVVDETVKSVAGVKGHTAVKNAKSFEVTGDFNDKELFAALNKAGLAGRVGK